MGQGQEEDRLCLFLLFLMDFIILDSRPGASKLQPTHQSRHNKNAIWARWFLFHTTATLFIAHTLAQRHTEKPFPKHITPDASVPCFSGTVAARCEAVQRLGSCGMDWKAQHLDVVLFCDVEGWGLETTVLDPQEGPSCEITIIFE